MFRYNRLIRVSVLFVLLFGAFTVGSSAQNNASPYTGLNVLLLIDQSSSMGGPPFGGVADYGPAGTDPNGLRFAGPQYAVMHVDYLLQSTPMVKNEVNIALVAFGTEQRLILDWQTIGKNTLTTNWLKTKADILGDLSESRWTGRNLKETNFEGAFNQADTYFNRAPSTPGINYRNVILVLTDGAPCVSADPAFQETLSDGRIVYNCLLPGRREAMKQHLMRLYNFTRSQFVPPKFELYVIAVDVGIPQPYWSEFETDWGRIVCESQSTCDPSLRYRKVDDANQVGIQINRILNDALSGILPPFDTQSINVPPGQFTIKPLQQALRVDIFKRNNDSANASFTVNGAPVQPLKIDALSAIDMYEFSQPTPGAWTLTLTTDVAGVQYSTLPPIVTAEGLPDEGDVFSTVPVTFTLAKSDGTALTADPNYPPSLVTAVASVYDATLIDRDQRPKLTEFPLVDAANGTYSYTGQWTPLKDGVYEVRISASYVNPSGVTEMIVDNQTVKDRIEIAGSFVEWQGVQPLSERADKTFTVMGMVKNAMTSVPVRNTSALKVRVTLTKPDGSIYKEEVFSNEGQAPGEIKVSFQAEAGVYNAQLEVLHDDGINPPQTLGTPSIPQQIEVRAVHPLVLQIIQPPAGNVEAQAFSLWPFELNLNVPMPVQVVLLDTLNNQYVSLATATNGAESVPTFMVNGELKPLTELQAGVYTIQLTDLAMAEYRMTASVNTPDALLIGDYSWASPNAQNAQTVINRTFSGSLALAILTMIAILITLGVIGFLLWRRSVWLAQYPLQGKVSFGFEDTGDDENTMPIADASFDLEKRTAHTQTFKNVRLPGSFQIINKVTISTRRDQSTSDNGEAFITELVINGEKIAYPRKLISGEFWASVFTSPDGQQRLMVRKEAATDFYTSGLFSGSGLFGGATEINMKSDTRASRYGGTTQIE